MFIIKRNKYFILTVFRYSKPDPQTDSGWWLFGGEFVIIRCGQGHKAVIFLLVRGLHLRHIKISSHGDKLIFVTRGNKSCGSKLGPLKSHLCKINMETRTLLYNISTFLRAILQRINFLHGNFILNSIPLIKKLEL